MTLTDEGNVKIQGEATEEAVRSGLRRLETEKSSSPGAEFRSKRKWPKLRSVFRDVASKKKFFFLDLNRQEVDFNSNLNRLGNRINRVCGRSHLWRRVDGVCDDRSCPSHYFRGNYILHVSPIQ